MKYTYGGSMKHVRSGEIFGTNIRFQIPRGANEQTYAVPAPDCILPAEQAFPVFCYTEGNSVPEWLIKERTVLLFWASLSKVS